MVMKADPPDPKQKELHVQPVAYVGCLVPLAVLAVLAGAALNKTLLGR
jgi:hypothetical protein